MEVFGSDWARAWMVEINADPSYREAGRGWHGAIVLRMWADEADAARSLYVDLEDGECLAARVASDADAASAPYVIGAPRDTWRSVLEGGVDPILGLLQGKLKLERGNLLKLVPYARAAKVLLSAAGRVPGVSPQAAAEGAEGAEDAGDVGTTGAVRAPRERAPLSRALDVSLVPT
jgi:putative sterol carrier protein